MGRIETESFMEVGQGPNCGYSAKKNEWEGNIQ
jgi:hypothetical protein